MKALTKLKDDARKHEQKEEWDKAIQLYLEVLRTAEEGEGESELPLYNRVGDLYVRLGRPNDAVTFYERAADRYGEAGLFNNAIALCNKALRYLPSRTELLRKLGQFSASQGFITEARRWYLEYAERKLNEGVLDDAFQALDDFASIHEDADVREVLGRQLLTYNRAEHAVRELKKAYELRLSAGQSDAAVKLMDEILTLDPEAFAEGVPASPPPPEPISYEPPQIQEWAPPTLDTVPPGLVDLGLESAAGAAFAGGDVGDAGFIDIGALDVPGLDVPGTDLPDFETPLTGSPEPSLDEEAIEPAQSYDVGLVDIDSSVLDGSLLAGDEPMIEPLPLIETGVPDDDDLDNADHFDLPLLEDAPDRMTGSGFDAPELDDSFDTEYGEPLPLLGVDDFGQLAETPLVDTPTPETEEAEPLPDLSFDGPTSQAAPGGFALTFEVETPTDTFDLDAFAQEPLGTPEETELLPVDFEVPPIADAESVWLELETGETESGVEWPDFEIAAEPGSTAGLESMIPLELQPQAESVHFDGDTASLAPADVPFEMEIPGEAAPEPDPFQPEITDAIDLGMASSGADEVGADEAGIEWAGFVTAEETTEAGWTNLPTHADEDFFEPLTPDVAAESAHAAPGEAEPTVFFEPEPAASTEPEPPVAFESEAPVSFEPEAPVSFEPEAPVSFEPEAPVSFEPDAPVAFEPEAPVSFEPEAPVSSEPEPPAPLEPAYPVALEPEAFDLLESEAPDPIEPAAATPISAQQPVPSIESEAADTADTLDTADAGFGDADSGVHYGEAAVLEYEDESDEAYEDAYDDAYADGLLDWREVFAAAQDFARRGEVAAAIEELAILHESLAAEGQYSDALLVTEELVRLDPGSINHLQQRVEYATKAGEGSKLVRAYLDLAERLTRSGGMAKANVIFQRVLDIEPTNAEARNAVYGAQPPVKTNEEGYVDLFSLLNDDDDEMGTRFVVAEKPPTGDEDRDFADMLSQFKQKIADHVPFDDAASHYDLGLAFKEMGLVDEAIAEFQIALKGSQDRLKIYEELGHCFLLKQQYNIAVTILNRALSMRTADDSDLVGVYYHMARSYEELGQRTEAKAAFERVVGVDISFKDAADRLARL